MPSEKKLYAVVVQFTVRIDELPPSRTIQDVEVHLAGVAASLGLKLASRQEYKESGLDRILVTFGQVFINDEAKDLHDWAKSEFDAWDKLAKSGFASGITKIAFIVDINDEGKFALWNPPDRILSPTGEAWLQGRTVKLNDHPGLLEVLLIALQVL